MPEVGASKFPLNWSMASSRAGYQLQDAGHWWVLVMVLKKKTTFRVWWENVGQLWIMLDCWFWAFAASHFE